MENIEELGTEGIDNYGNKFNPKDVGETQQIKITPELIDKLDLYNSKPEMRSELARLCMYSQGGDIQAIDTAYTALRGEAHKVSFTDMFKAFGHFIQQEFDLIKNNYLHVRKRDDWMLKYDEDILTGKCLVGITKDLKLIFCYYKKSTGKFHESLAINSPEVHPIAFFKHINPQELFDLMNDASRPPRPRVKRQK